MSSVGDRLDIKHAWEFFTHYNEWVYLREGGSCFNCFELSFRPPPSPPKQTNIFSLFYFSRSFVIHRNNLIGQHGLPSSGLNWKPISLEPDLRLSWTTAKTRAGATNLRLSRLEELTASLKQRKSTKVAPCLEHAQVGIFRGTLKSRSEKGYKVKMHKLWLSRCWGTSTASDVSRASRECHRCLQSVSWKSSQK